MLFTSFEKYLKNCKGAIHVGANVGEERNWYALHGFSPVLWFEPNKDLYPVLSENLKGFCNQFAFNIGVHDSLEHATLHISSNDGQSSSILELGLHAKYHPKVKYIKDQKINLCRLDEFISNMGRNIKDFNFLNVDVQGVELNVIKSLGKQLAGFDYLYIEVNEQELYKGCAFITEIDYYVSLFGFSRMATHMTKNHWGDAFYMNTKINEA